MYWKRRTVNCRCTGTGGQWTVDLLEQWDSVLYIYWNRRTVDCRFTGTVGQCTVDVLEQKDSEL
jgi:hypothetical protein